jgi:predicted amidohydrolase YtcJ
MSTRQSKKLSQTGSKPEATLLIQNAKIVTLDGKGTIAESLVAIGDRIVAVGSNKELANLAGPRTEKLDLGGRTVLPGFIDAHEHLAIFSQNLLQLDLSPPKVTSTDELLKLVRSEADHLSVGEWIRGVLYDDTKMRDGRTLTREDLDSVAPNHPVIVIHVSGNIGIVNSEALRRGGLDEKIPDPKGGKLGRDPKTGKLTGQLYSNALFSFAFESMNREGPVVPPFERNIRKKALLDGTRILNRAGVTSVTDAWGSPNYFTTYHDVTADKSLTVRVNMLIFFLWLPELETLGLIGNWGNEWVRCTGIKLIVDGAIAGRTAALRDGYSHNSDDHGILVFEDPEELNGLVRRIHRLGYQACIHANGDLAIEMALDAIQKAQLEYPRPDPRHRIEHCTIINENILRRMRNLGVMAIPFGSYLWQHGEKIIPYYGKERAEVMFAHKSFLDSGVRVAGASDHPAGLHPPLLGVQCMVTRKTANGEAIGLRQKISIEEAFKMYTVYAAYSSFEENIKGSLTVGKLADIVILAQDPWLFDPEKIGQIGVDMTIVGGRIVYSRL